MDREAIIAYLAESQYFDVTYYTQGVAAAKLTAPAANDAIGHYLDHGEKMDIAPSLRFDPKFYTTQYPDLKKLSESYLFHFVRAGKAEGRHGTLADLILAQGLGPSVYPLECLPFVFTDNYERDQKNLQHLINIAGIFPRDVFFSSDVYNKLYPDVGRARINPLFHYLASGHRENRKSSVSLFRKIKIDESLYDSAKPVLIVGAHELSKTGAPLVAVNVAQELKSRFNIVFMAGKGGKLESAVEGQFFATIVTDGLDISLAYAMQALGRFEKPIGAIFSSIECEKLVEGMANFDIPSVMLIHEYTEYTFPTYKKYVPLLFCESVVYSSHHLKASWKDFLTDVCFDGERVLVCPQPKTIAEGGAELTTMPKKDARARVAKALGLKSIDKRRIVIGAGQVQIRKGTDMFLQIADRLSREKPGEYLFVWIGEFPPDTDMAFGVWLHAFLNKQIADNPDVYLIPSGEVYIALQAAADAFVLPSRLDPLPNVVLDALEAGQALFYFDNASGVREFVESHEMHTAFASPYLDVFDMSDRIRAYFDAPAGVSKPKKAVAAKELAFDSYATYSDWLVNVVTRSAKATASRTPEILPRINPEYIGTLTQTGAAMRILDNPTETDNERHARIAAQMLARGTVFLNPDHGVGGYDIARGKNEPYRCLEVDQDVAEWRDVVPDTKVFVHIHAHYTELFGEILRRVTGLGITHNIIVTTSTQEKVDEIMKIAEVAHAEVEAVMVDNRGRDIGPFLDVCAEHFSKNPKAIFGHFHTKKSELIDSATAAVWRDKLLRTLLNASALRQFADDRVKLIFPDEMRSVGWGRNLSFATDLAKKHPDLKFNHEHPGAFPVGNMFWVSGEVGAEMRRLTKHIVWPDEPVGYDGSILHTIERLWPWVCQKTGWEWAAVYDNIATK